jgi:hypothetical protein
MLSSRLVHLGTPSNGVNVVVGQVVLEMWHDVRSEVSPSIRVHASAVLEVIEGPAVESKDFAAFRADDRTVVTTLSVAETMHAWGGCDGQRVDRRLLRAGVGDGASGSRGKQLSIRVHQCRRPRPRAKRS